jgi:hypothetical protein
MIDEYGCRGQPAVQQEHSRAEEIAQLLDSIADVCDQRASTAASRAGTLACMKSQQR